MDYRIKSVESETLTNKPLEWVNPNIYHIADKEQEYTLYELLQKTWDYINLTPTDTNELEVKKSLTDFYEKIIKQCAEDNSNTKSIPKEIADLSEVIEKNSKFQLKDYSEPLLHTTKSITRIYRQYIALLGYIKDYKEIANYTVPSDRVDNAKIYNDFIDKAMKKYVSTLKECSKAIAEASRLDRRALYTLMFQFDKALIDPNTEITPFVSNIKGVQNSRLFRNRTNTIIAIKDTISTCNIIRIMWFLEVLNHNISGIEDLTPNPDWENGLDSDDLDEIGGALGNINDYVGNLTDNFGGVAETADALKSLANNASNKSRVNRYLDELEHINSVINNAYSWLSSLKLEINLTWTNKIVQKLAELLDKLEKWLNLPNLEHLINHINGNIDKINQTAATMKNASCLLNQAMCKLAGLLNFMDTVIGPLFDQLIAILEAVNRSFDGALEYAQERLVKPKLKAIQRAVADTARANLKTRASPEIVKVLGLSMTESIKISQIIDLAVDEYLGYYTDPEALENMKKTASDSMNRQKASFKSGLSAANGMNCPPITFGSLNMPNLTISSTLPKLNTVNPDVSC